MIIYWRNIDYIDFIQNAFTNKTNIVFSFNQTLKFTRVPVNLLLLNNSDKLVWHQQLHNTDS